jgi:hypothetical protein
MKRRKSIRRENWMDPRVNVCVRTRDKDGFVVDEHVSHNIYLDNGRAWLLRRMSPRLLGVPSSAIVPGALPPPAEGWNPSTTWPPGLDGAHTLSFIGVGCGGREQLLQPSTWPPTIPPDHAFWGAYAAAGFGAPSFAQDDTDTSINGLEVPAAYFLGPPPPPGAPYYSRKWLKEITTVEFEAVPKPTWVKYTVLFGVNELNDAYGGQDVPVSEVAIYPADVASDLIVEPSRDLHAATQAVAYEAFPTILKVAGVLQLEVQWAFRM